MKTRKELLVELVAGFGNWTPLGESWNSEEARAKYAVKQLAAIEKVCGDAPMSEPSDLVSIHLMQGAAAIEATARAAERERCAKIAEEYASEPRTPYPSIAALEIANAIRRGGA